MSNSPIKTWIHGADGRMGTVLQETISENKSFALIGGSGKNFLDSGLHKEGAVTAEKLAQELKHCELVIDFSSIEGNAILSQAIGSMTEKPAVLIATTGLKDDHINEWKNHSKSNKGCSILLARNTSLGISLTLQAALACHSVLKDLNFDVEISESHHRNKVDAPSGTALLLAESIAKSDKKLNIATDYSKGRPENALGVSVKRGGMVFGEHTVSFLGDSEEIHITHRALNRNLFAKGALVLGQWVQKKVPGFRLVEEIKPDELI